MYNLISILKSEFDKYCKQNMTLKKKIGHFSLEEEGEESWQSMRGQPQRRLKYRYTQT